MKEKILNALKTEYKTLGLGEKAFDGVASFLEKTITDEANIETAIKEAQVVAILKGFQADTDGIRTAKSKAEKEFEEYKKAHPTTTQTPPPTKTEEDSEVMKLLKQIQEENKELKDKYAANEAKAQRDALVASVRKSIEDSKRTHEGILDIIFKNIEIGEGDTQEVLSERLTKQYDEQYKKFYGDGGIPPFGSGVNPTRNDKNPFGGVVATLQQRGVLDKDEQ